MIIPDRAPSEEQFWLVAYLTAFLQSLIAHGYRKYTIETYRRISQRLCDMAQVRNISPSELDVDTMTNLADACLTTDSLCMKQQVTTVVHRFTEYLIAVGVIIVRKEPVPSPRTIEHLCMELDHWLRSQRGLYGDRLRVYPKILTQFVQHCNADKDMVQNLALVSPENILAFVDKITVSSTWRIPYLRNILRFLFWRNYVPGDLSAIIPPTASAKTDGLPCHLERATINRLLKAIQNDTPRDRRDYAMLLLMVRLGLRAQEIRAIQFDDFDWNTGRILIRGKLSQFDYMPIPVDVGQAIIAWLRSRQGQTRHLFVSLYPPFAALQTSRPILWALKRAYKLAELPLPPGKVRTHSLRHSLAMQLLHQGSSLAEIGDVLRHRCYDSTTAYARYDVETLREIARPWPIKGGNK